MQFTYYGQSCFSVNHQGLTILFDPFISGNPLAGDIDVQSIPADYILLSHGHTDHILDAEAIALRTGAKVVCSWEIHEWMNEKGISNTHPMNTGGAWSFESFKVKCVVAQHSSSLPDGTYGGNPMGFIITFNDYSFYYSGDTALTLDMQLIPLWTKLDCAVLPIGDNFTMGYEDALRAADFVQCQRILGVHFDTFGFIKIDHEVVKNAFEKAGKQLKLPTIGETFEL
jgi:L-ascorbate metabolism protein UlaG (beta-lactamase superfamily)